MKQHMKFVNMPTMFLAMCIRTHKYMSQKINAPFIFIAIAFIYI